METTDIIKTANEAYLKMQQNLPVIPKTRDGFHFRYAPYETVYRLAFPVVWSHGFYIRHDDGPDGVTTTLLHVPTGMVWTSVFSYDKSSQDQDHGKSLTYGKRYNTVLLLGLSIEGEPDSDDTKVKPANGGSEF